MINILIHIKMKIQRILLITITITIIHILILIHIKKKKNMNTPKNAITIMIMRRIIMIIIMIIMKNPIITIHILKKPGSKKTISVIQKKSAIWIWISIWMKSTRKKPWKSISMTKIFRVFFFMFSLIHWVVLV